jgi:hypothetical protein
MTSVRIKDRRSRRRVAGGLLTLAGCLILATATPAAATTGTHAGQSAVSSCGIQGASQLFSGCELQPNQALEYGTLALTMQGDGNIVLSDQGHAMWANGETGHPNSYLAMQGDGNLVEYSAQSVALWSTGTTGSTDYAQLTPSGGFGVYDQCCRLWGTPLPNTTFRDTSSPTDVLFPGQALVPGQELLDSSGDYRVSMQGGLLTITFLPTNDTYFEVGFPCSGSSEAVMQTDGNLVVYCNGVAQWATDTGGHPSSGGLYLHIQDDGTMAIYNSYGGTIWRV